MFGGIFWDEIIEMSWSMNGWIKVFVALGAVCLILSRFYVSRKHCEPEDKCAWLTVKMCSLSSDVD